jgi:putative endonuclease
MGRRFAEHSGSPKGAKFTRANPPTEIMAVWSCDGRSIASKLECAIKKLRREDKMRLINSEIQLSDFFGDENQIKRNM